MKNTPYLVIMGLLLLFTGKPLYAQTKLSLKATLEMAKQGNKAIQVQRLEEKQANEMTRESKSYVLPDVSANLAYAYYFNRQVIFLPGSFAGTSKPVQDVAVGGKNVYNGFVVLSQPILVPSAYRNIVASKINEKIQIEKTADLESQMALQISLRYLDLLMMGQQLGLLEQSLQRNIRALHDSKALLKQGRGLKSDTLSGFVAVENLKSSLSYLKNNIAVSQIELKRVIGMDEATEIELTDALESAITESSNDFYAIGETFKMAVANRSDLHVQKLTVDLQQKKLEAAKANLAPKLSLIGQYQVQAQADNLKFNQYAWPSTSFVGLQLTVPIFSGNRTKSQINQAKIKAAQENIRFSDLKEKVKTELAAIGSKGKEALTQLQVHESTVKSALLNYQMMEDRFKNGLASRLELNDAELALTQAKISRLQAVYNLRVSHTELLHALGLLSL